MHWTQVYGSTAFVCARLEKHRGRMRPDKCLAAILHCYDRRLTSLLRAGKECDPQEFQPDGQLMRANAYMALAHDSSGLIWWWYGQGSKSFTVARAPKAWAALRKIVAEIKELSPLLVAEGEVHTSVAKPKEGAEVHVWEKKCRDRTVVIAVNRDKEACEVSFALRTLPGDRTAKVLWENRSVKVVNGKLSDHFAPLAVHVYSAQ